MDERILTVAKRLENNNMRAITIESRAEVVPLLKLLMPKGAKVGCGGSVTLEECGVFEFLRNGDYTFYDRFKGGLSKEQFENTFAMEKQTDFFLCSANAITEDGAIYNVDGRANRVAAICHGPKNVIIIAGRNKIVKNIDEAVIRVKTIAAPKNSQRLGYDTYCRNAGICVDPAPCMYSGCSSPQRICCHYLVTGFQRIKDRIIVILIDKELGY